MYSAFLLPASLVHNPLVIRPSPRCPQWRSALIAVAGATGGVGSLVVSRLLSSPVLDQPNHSATNHAPTEVRALVRSIEKAKKRLPGTDRLEVVQIPPTFKADENILREALRGVEVLVICTGTTAFPTRAWRGGNTPQNVDDRGVKTLVEAVDACIKRVVLVSSIGTCRSAAFPFFILNAFGVIDAKRKGEIHVIEAAQKNGFSYAILRPGRLIGAPHSNVGMWRKEPHLNCRDVVLARGDTLSGELSREAAAEAVITAVGWDINANFNVSLVHRKGQTPHRDHWKSLFSGVQTVRERQSWLQE